MADVVKNGDLNLHTAVAFYRQLFCRDPFKLTMVVFLAVVLAVVYYLRQPKMDEVRELLVKRYTTMEENLETAYEETLLREGFPVIKLVIKLVMQLLDQPNVFGSIRGTRSLQWMANDFLRTATAVYSGGVTPDSIPNSSQNNSRQPASADGRSRVSSVGE